MSYDHQQVYGYWVAIDWDLMAQALAFAGLPWVLCWIGGWFLAIWQRWKVRKGIRKGPRPYRS